MNLQFALVTKENNLREITNYRASRPQDPGDGGRWLPVTNVINALPDGAEHRYELCVNGVVRLLPHGFEARENREMN